MVAAVRYYSKSGNTKKLAEAIGKEIGVNPEETGVPIKEPVDILFLGGALYAGDVDSNLRDFLRQLSPNQVKKIAVFSTAAGPNTILPKVQALAKEKGIEVEETCYSCRGKFLFVHRGRPNQEDCAGAASFARDILKSGS